MRSLIENVRAEADIALKAAIDDDEYPKARLEENERKRTAARQRIKDCDDALEALDSAAESLTRVRK